MTRKRAVKLLMARGYRRNRANALMYHKSIGESNFLKFGNCCKCEDLYDSIAQLSDAFYRYGTSTMALDKALRAMFAANWEEQSNVGKG